MELTIELMYDMRSVFLEKDEEKKVSPPFIHGTVNPRYNDSICYKDVAIKMNLLL